MKQTQRVAGGLLALLLLFGAGWLLIDLLQNRTEVELAQQPAMTPEVAHSVPTPISTPISGWKTATLEQIQFGKPKVILTDTHSLRIVQWISDEELLVLRGLTSNRSEEAIELFNVSTNQTTRLAIGDYLRKPIWLPTQQAVAFLSYNLETKQRDLMISSIDTKAPQTLYEGVSLPLLAGGDGQGVAAFSENQKVLLQVGDTGQKAQVANFDFAPFAAPSPTPYEWIYKTAQSPNTPWQVVYNIDHSLLINLGTGKLQEIDLSDEKWEQNYPPLWALDVQWSPDGNKLAVIATMGRLPNTFRQLLVYDLQADRLEEIDLPADFTLNNLAWAPDSRFLLAQGSVGLTKKGSGLQGSILIDTVTGQSQVKDIFPPQSIGGDTGWELSWSPDGQLVAFYCRKSGQGYSSVCLTRVEVQK